MYVLSMNELKTYHADDLRTELKMRHIDTHSFRA